MLSHSVMHEKTCSFEQKYKKLSSFKRVVAISLNNGHLYVEKKAKFPGKLLFEIYSSNILLFSFMTLTI